jgi:hypothetical protein
MPDLYLYQQQLSVNDHKGNDRSASGLKSAIKPASGLKSAIKPASGLKSAIKPASGLKSAIKPASGLKSAINYSLLPSLFAFPMIDQDGLVIEYFLGNLIFSETI